MSVVSWMLCVEEGGGIIDGPIAKQRELWILETWGKILRTRLRKVCLNTRKDYGTSWTENTKPLKSDWKSGLGPGCFISKDVGNGLMHDS